MFRMTPEHARREIEAAEKCRDLTLDLSDEFKERHKGSHFQEGQGPVIEAHENHEYETIVNTVPHIAFHNPVVRCSSPRPTVFREVCESMEIGLNRWIRHVNLAEALYIGAVDMMFDFGILQVTMEPVAGYEDMDSPPLLPSVVRVSQRRFFIDPQGMSWDTARFMGHMVIRDKDDLLSAVDNRGKPIYRREIVERLATESEVEEHVSLPDSVERVERGQVVVREMYVPETGKIYTLAWGASGQNGEAAWLRKPRKCFCPRWGPYQMFGINVSPDQVYPLSPLAISAGLVEELNAMEDQAARQADRARSMTIYDSKNKKLKEAVERGDDGDNIGIPGFNRNMLEKIDFDGPSEGLLAYIDRLRFRLDRKSGITQTMQGNLTGVTKGEVDTAQANADVRISFIRQRFMGQVAKLLKTVAWMMWHSQNVVLPVSMKSGGNLAPPGDEEEYDGWFIGGIQPGQEDLAFEELDLDIVPESMPYRSPMVRKAEFDQAMMQAQTMAPAMPQMPWVKWGVVWDDYCREHDIRDGRRWFDFDLLDTMNMMQGMGVSLTQPGSPRPEATGLQAALPGGGGRPGGAGPQGMGRMGPAQGPGGPKPAPALAMAPAGR